MAIDPILSWLGKGVEFAGIAILVGGAIVASGIFLRDCFQESAGTAYHHYRANLGRGILLGLEFLVIGDIIGTVALDFTFENLGLLAIIVLIRTFLSFALEIEIAGTLPWRRERGGAPHTPAAEQG